MSEQDGICVTWPKLITFLLSLLGLLGGVGGWTYWVHASRPHAGSVSQREHDGLKSTIFSRLDRIENKLDRVLQGK